MRLRMLQQIAFLLFGLCFCATAANKPIHIGTADKAATLSTPSEGLLPRRNAPSPPRTKRVTKSPTLVRVNSSIDKSYTPSQSYAEQKKLGPDPIRFMLSSSKDSVSIGEEFEIKITAELLPISPQTMFFFEDQKSFSLKVTTPSGFVQTGGNYHDFIGANFSETGRSRIEYTLKGKLTSLQGESTFALLKGKFDNSANDLFERKAELSMKISDTSAHRSTARVQSKCSISDNDIDIAPLGTYRDSLIISVTILKDRTAEFEYSVDDMTYNGKNVMILKNGIVSIYIRSKGDKECKIKIDNILNHRRTGIYVANQSEGCTGPYSLSASIDVIYENLSGVIRLNQDRYDYVRWSKKINNEWTEFRPSDPSFESPFYIIMGRQDTDAGTYRAAVDCGGVTYYTNEVKVTRFAVRSEIIRQGCNSNSTTNSSAAGDNLVKIVAHASGGRKPYVYHFTKQYGENNNYPPQSDSVLTILENGDYGIEAWDKTAIDFMNATGYPYQIASSTNFFSVIVPQPLTATAQSIYDCSASVNNINIVANGGVAPLYYSIDNRQTFQLGSTFTVSGGNYVYVVKDANGCTTTGVVKASSGGSPRIVAGGSRSSCGNQATGGANVVVRGGIAPYQYSKDYGQTYQNSPHFERIAGGIYYIIVKDANGCVSAPYKIEVSETLPAVLNTSTVDAVCADASGKIEGRATGGYIDDGSSSDYGYDPWLYSINGGAFSKTSSFSVPPGSYTLTAKNYYCTVPAAVTVKGPPVATTIGSISSLPSGCSTPTGSLTVLNATGVSPLAYSIDGTIYQTSNVFTALKAGKYTIYVKDKNGCLASKPYSISLEGGNLSGSVDAVSVDCAQQSGTVTVQASGGTAPYQYSLDGTTFQTSNTFLLQAGGYNITLRDATGCQTNLKAVVSQPDLLEVMAEADPIRCKGSKTSVRITAKGGTASYAYQVNGQTISSTGITDLAPGTYTIQVVDAKGCSIATSVDITEPAEPVTVQVLPIAPINCANGVTRVTLQTTGGTGSTPQYSLDGGITFSATNVFDLSAGEYQVIARDIAGCLSAPKQVAIAQPTALNISNVAINPAVCQSQSGSITVNADGGTAPLQYSINGLFLDTKSTFQNLPAGNHIILVKDSKGCQISQNVSVPLNGGNLSVSLATTNPTCEQNNGAITATVTGGTPPFQYLWGNSSTTTSLSNLGENIYTLLVRDANNCSYRTTTQLTGTNKPVAIAANSGPLVSGRMLALRADYVEGASYSWYGPNNFTSTEQNPVIANATTGNSGAYTVQVTKDGCLASAVTEATITNCSISFADDPTWVCNGAQTTVSAQVVNATPGKEVQIKVDDSNWTTGTSLTIENLSQGNHIVSIRERLSNTYDPNQECFGGSRTITTTICKKKRKLRDRNPNCGMPPQVDLSNVAVLSELVVGDTVWAGDYEVIVSNVLNGGSGRWQFEGYAQVPQLYNARVFLQSETDPSKGGLPLINDEYVMVGGAVVTKFDLVGGTIIDASAIVRDVKEAITQLADMTITTDRKKIESVTKQLVEQARKELPPDLVAKISDASKEVLAAKDAYDKATTPAEKDAAAARLATAKQQLQEANQQRDNFLNQYAEIIRLALESIKTATSNLTGSENERQAALTAIGYSVNETGGSLKTTFPNIVLINEGSVNTAPSAGVQNYFTKEIARNDAWVANSFANALSQGSKYRQLGQDLKKNSNTLAQYIYQEQQKGTPQASLVADVAAQLREYFKNIMLQTTYGVK